MVRSTIELGMVVLDLCQKLIQGDSLGEPEDDLFV